MYYNIQYTMYDILYYLISHEEEQIINRISNPYDWNALPNKSASLYASIRLKPSNKLKPFAPIRHMKYIRKILIKK